MEGKLSLVAAFDDLIRCATVLNTGCEAEFRSFVLNQEDNRRKWLSAEQKTDSNEDKIKRLQSEKSTLETQVKHARNQVQYELTRRNEVEQERSSLLVVCFRDFIEKYLVDFTRENPGTVVYVKPIRNRAPFLVAEYLNGRQERVSTKDMPADEVCKWLEHLRTRSGAQIVNLRKEWLTNTPSIQGVWHPFLNKNPSLAGTSFPAPELYGAKTESKSATDMVLEEAGVKKVGSVDSASSKE
ncbi:uncharacterized protein [Littorina saxatilis]|uniref:uncharacterized protein n=1 Tax=Littorina saxatilis TaxID=31220 RepID=UPI0038B46F4A